MIAAITRVTKQPLQCQCDRVMSTLAPRDRYQIPRKVSARELEGGRKKTIERNSSRKERRVGDFAQGQRFAADQVEEGTTTTNTTFVLTKWVRQHKPGQRLDDKPEVRREAGGMKRWASAA